jgi:hypothetical protein
MRRPIPLLEDTISLAEHAGSTQQCTHVCSYYLHELALVGSTGLPLDVDPLSSQPLYARLNDLQSTAVEPSLTVLIVAVLMTVSAVQTAIQRLFKMAMGLMLTFKICKM